MNILNIGSKENLRAKFKDGICTEFCLKLWLEKGSYFYDITESGWFSKRLFRNKVPNNHVLKLVWKSVSLKNCPEAHSGTLDNSFQLND